MSKKTSVFFYALNLDSCLSAIRVYNDLLYKVLTLNRRFLFKCAR